MGKSGHLGELEQMVLLAVLRLAEDDAYGSRVRDELQTKADRGVARGALYVTLDRLVEKGMLDTRVGDPTPGRGGRPRRYPSRHHGSPEGAPGIDQFVGRPRRRDGPKLRGAS